MLKIIEIEARLFVRDRLNSLFALVFPSVLLLVLGAIPALRTPDENFGGQRFIDSYVSALVVFTLAFIGLQRLPAVVATYREKGVLRRLSTTPMHPARLLAGQMVVNFAAVILSVLLLIVVGYVVFGVDLPHHPLGLACAVVLGGAGTFALGLVIAALAPNARSAGGWATVVFMLLMFFGGVYLPRFMLPSAIQAIGSYTPPGVEALQQAWLGTAPDWRHLAIMGLVSLVAGTVAAKTFRWE
ncbi:ABC transporter permease [Lentzea flaviverrucosa]|uniref:Transport permease protein n=1 Tax=Lentzea flaviverrucosa TaxID=200379 RepID=A0A1H9SQW1_9PSEU|nr:ABC transporter permease [Lentzea flaviverrucosa]RDI25480.1 ABC-2 type transport system permease protein [Lentzea flaviverrucosa]SER87346.1 ABC-2 type transport system permease protein [Lentzea flaviverrucosa]